MKMTRRNILGIGFASGALVLQGCVTRMTDALYKNSKYTETLDAIYISENKKKLVFIGNKYHYIFDVPPKLSSALGASFRKKLAGTFDTFFVESDGHIAGGYRLYLPNKTTAREEDEASAIGFEKNENGIYSLEERIAGTRYTASTPIIANGNAEKMNQVHHITIEEMPGAIQTIGRIAATPVTVLTDGVLSIGLGIALIPLMIFVGPRIIN